MRYVCDRCASALRTTRDVCGKEVIETKVFHNRMGHPEIALCEQCSVEFYNWLNGPKLEPEK